MIRILICALGLSILAGCASNTKDFRDHPSVDEIYGHLNDNDQTEVVSDLRRSLTVTKGNGTGKPYYPLRNPEVIVPIWVRPSINQVTDAKIQPHWEWVVIEESSWAE